MVESDSNMSEQKIRQDMLETFTLELSDDPRIKKIVESSTSKIDSIKNLRRILTDEEDEDYADLREQLDKIPSPPKREGDSMSPMATVDESGVRAKFNLPPSSNDLEVAKVVVDILFEQKEKKD